jgi:hypothetical protein
LYPTVYIHDEITGPEFYTAKHEAGDQTIQSFHQIVTGQMKKYVREDPAYPVGVGALDERGGGEEPIAMVGVRVELEQHTVVARGLSRQEIIHREITR